MDEHPKRRWLQLSLRTLLVAITLVAAFLAIVANRARNQRQACAAVRQLAGNIQYDYVYDMRPSYGGIPTRTKSEPLAPKWLRDLLGEEYFVGVCGVTLTDATDRNLDFLKLIPKLQLLSLEQSAITDDGLVAIANQTELVYLWLDDTKISDAGLVHLHRMKKLRFLYIRDANVTDEGAAALKRQLPHARICYGTDLSEKFK